jgi:hypothetical protein
MLEQDVVIPKAHVRAHQARRPVLDRHARVHPKPRPWPGDVTTYSI